MVNDRPDQCLCVSFALILLSQCADIVMGSQFRAMYVFGDSLVDNGNNNYINSIAKANYYPYGCDFVGGPSGRFCNGKNFVDLLGDKLGLPPPAPYAAPGTTGTRILGGVNYASAAAGILDETGRHYRYTQGREPKIYELHKSLHSLTQGTQSITEYFTQLQIIWNGLNMFSPLPTCSCGVINGCACNFMSKLQEREQNHFRMVFLMGLNDDFAKERSQILMMKPIPPLDDVFSLLCSEESSRLANSSSRDYSESMVLAVNHNLNMKNSFAHGTKIAMQCSYFQGTNYVRETCYKLHGYPLNYRAKDPNYRLKDNQGRGKGRGILGYKPHSHSANQVSMPSAGAIAGYNSHNIHSASPMHAHTNTTSPASYYNGPSYSMHDSPRMTEHVNSNYSFTPAQFNQLCSIVQSQGQGALRPHSPNKSAQASITNSVADTPFSNMAFTGLTNQANDWDC